MSEIRLHRSLAWRLGNKIHALVDANVLPIALKLTAGQADDGCDAADMLYTLGNGDVLLADRAHDSDALRIEKRRGAWANIKLMQNRKRRLVFSTFLYQCRNVVEGQKEQTADPLRCIWRKVRWKSQIKSIACAGL